ncbi:MAG: CHAT domain-containing protein [Thermoanaerobaculia bacterium]
MPAPANPRLRVTVSPGWEVLPPVKSMRARALAVDPFLARALEDGRLELAEVRSVRPRRGAAARAGLFSARIEAASSSGWVLVARHPSGALTFHPAGAIEGGTHRFEVHLAPPPAELRGLGAAVRVFFLRLAGAVAGALLPALARAWEKKRFKEAHIPFGLVRLLVQGGKLVTSHVERPSLPRAPVKGLLFLHGTFSHASAAFSDLARDGAFEALSKLYEGRVFAFNHLTVGRSPHENVTALLETVRGASLDLVTHSRGGLVARLLASSAGAPQVNRVFLVASPNEGTPLASPARWDRLAAWLANLGEMFPGGALAFGLDFAAEALVWMARRAGGTLPGIAAMDPAGEFLEKLNAVATRRYEAAAAVAQFEPKGSAARRLVDAATGVFFEDPNDLVVPTDGGTRLGAAPPVPEAHTVRFGPGDAVHHLNLFAQKETRERIEIFLEGKEGEARAGAREQRCGKVQRRKRGTSQPHHPSKHARSASFPRRFELVLVGGRGGTPAHLLATFGGARVVEPFETKGGAAGERMRRIIDLHERVLAALDGDGRHPLPAAKELRDYGAVLFETLFPGAVRRLWDEARAAAKGALEVVFTPGLDWIADKPWELAYDASRHRFLADDAVLVRGVFGAPPFVAPTPGRGPLHVLVALAEPRDAAPVTARQEAAAIRTALAPLMNSGGARLEILTSTTPGHLHRRLSAGRVDVLHFVGHGAFDEKEKTGALFLVDARGRSLAVDTDRVLRLLAGRGLKLVVLNACETGRGGRTDFLRGVAPALLAGGVPAVLANQYKVLDSSATAFARHLYWALAKGQSLGEAAREARVAVSYAKGAEPMDWAVPVLYARDTSLVFCRPARTP